MRMSMILALVAALSACAGTPRGAPLEGYGRMQAVFDAADADGDEALTREEVEAGMPELLPHFAEIDTNEDGRINGAELRSWLEWQRVLSTPPGGRIIRSR